MGPRKGSLRARASSIIRSPLATIHQGQLHDPATRRRASNASTQPTFNEKRTSLERSQSTSSGGNTHESSRPDERAHHRDAQRLVRTVPTWVHTREALERSFLSPDPVYVAQHNSNPSVRRNIHAPPGRSHDDGEEEEEEEWAPPWPGATIEDSTSRWRAFASATAYPRLKAEGGEIVTDDWLRQNGPDYYQPWLAGTANEDSETGMAGLFRSGVRRHAWYIRFERTTLRSPIVPMVIRMVVCGFSVIALALAGSIHRITNRPGSVIGQTPSTNMAIVIDAIAIVYLFYITYDEYSGKPLGLRSAKAKMRLIFLDLFFIVFESGNLSLAFVASRDNDCDIYVEAETCSGSEQNLFDDVLISQKALASVLFIALIAWMLTFAISIARLVERVTGR